MDVNPRTIHTIADAFAAYGETNTGSRSRISQDPESVQLKQKLRSALQDITSAGSFAFSGTIAKIPDPKLQINGIEGHVALPLRPIDAEELIRQARQAPYGKGSETLVDTAVRNTWELDAAQFRFNNPQWETCMKQFCAVVARELGIDMPIRAEIYKMLLYEKGAMFKAHTDTEKIPGMFGTLVIALPSAHEGGDLVLKHNGETKVFKTSTKQPSLASWYSDVSHEVLPVTSGYRWVLTYNLAIDPQHPRPTAAVSNAESPLLEQTLQNWLTQETDKRPNPWLYHVLDHEYTEANISMQMLKRKDRAVLQALKGACHTKPVDLFFALLEKKEMGDCEMDYDDFRGRRCGGWGYEEEEDNEGFHALSEVYEVTYKVKSLVDLEGKPVLKGLGLDEGDILQENCFEDLEAEEDYEGYMGNSGPSATHWYRTTAVVMVPRDSLLDYFNTGDVSKWGLVSNQNIQTMARYVLQGRSESGLTEAMSRVLLQMCKYAWSPELSSQGPLLDIDAIRGIMQFAITNNDTKLFEQAAQNHRGALGSDFFTWLRSHLTSNKNIEQRWAVLSQGVMTSFLHFSSFAKMLASLNVLAPVVVLPQERAQEDPLRYVYATIRSHLASILDRYLDPVRQDNKLPLLSNADGQAMVDLSMYHENSIEFLTEIMTPKILGRMNVPTFVLGFLAKLNRVCSTGEPFSDKVKSLYCDAARQFVTGTDFSKLCSPQPVPTRQQIYIHRQQQRQSTEVNSTDLVTFFSHIHEPISGLNDVLESFVAKTVESVSQFQGNQIHLLWVPFLLITMQSSLHKKSTAMLKYHQQLFVAILEAYIVNFVGQKPNQTRNFARRGVACHCGDCSQLNSFLNDGSREQERFSVNKQRRQHLHQNLDSSGADCTHVTDRSGYQPSGRALTLVVTKTFRVMKKALKEWETRNETARVTIKQFDQVELKTLLGDKYNAITSIVFPPQFGTSRPRTTLNQISGNTISPISTNLSTEVGGRKRKRPAEEIEVIDLTSD